MSPCQQPRPLVTRGTCPHVLRNLEAPIRVAGISKEEAKKTALGLLAKMGLEDKAEAYPYKLSGGQCQRVAIARALALKPVKKY